MARTDTAARADHPTMKTVVGALVGGPTVAAAAVGAGTDG